MLLPRSILKSHFCVLVLLATTVNSQYYNSEYSVNDDGEDDHSSYREDGDDRPDYSKYYNNQGSSAPLILGASDDVKDSDSGFVSPLDFSGFIGSSHFGLGAASTGSQQSLPLIQISNPFRVQNEKQNASGFVDANDFQSGFGNANLEFSPSNFASEAQNIGNGYDGNSFEPKTGPTYNTPKVAGTKYNKLNKESEVHDLNKPASYKKYEKTPVKSINYEKNSGYNKPSYDYSGEVAYNPVSTLSSYTVPTKTNYPTPLRSYTPKYVPLPTKYTNLQTTLNPSITPYQKYSFQPIAGIPAASYDSIKSTLAPYSTPYALPSTVASFYSTPAVYTAQPTEYSEKKVSSNCQKIQKQLSPEDISHGRFRRAADNMNCYLCKDSKSGGTYEQCSYTSQPNDDNTYFRGHAEKYSTKTTYNPDPEHNRKKRSPARKDNRNKRQKEEEEAAEEREEYENPFEQQKKNSHKFSSKPKEFESDSFYKSPDFSTYEKPESYEFGPEYYTDATQNEKSYSEIQSEEVKKGGNCKEVKKDSLTCMVCTNPKTGGNYEQCSYKSEPNEKKYAYVKEKKFNSNEPDEEKSSESTENKPTVQRKKQRSRPKSTKKIDDSPYHYSASTKHPKRKSEKQRKESYYNPEKYGQGESSEKRTKVDKYKQKNKEHDDDYIYKLFPEYAEKESRKNEQKTRPGFEFQSELPEYFTAEESKKDVDSVLQEFSKKDRSNCKKVAKNKMTCYLCVDDKGIQHEECMFVSASEPKSSHIAYHEVKEFKTEPKQKEVETAHSNQNPEIRPTETPKLKRKNTKKNPPVQIKDVDIKPVEYIKPDGKKPRIVRRKTNISKEFLVPQESQNSEVKVKNPKQEEEIEEPETEGAEGAYASELVPKYSEQYGMTLPAYMLQISEGEQMFDEVTGSG